MKASLSAPLSALVLLLCTATASQATLVTITRDNGVPEQVFGQDFAQLSRDITRSNQFGTASASGSLATGKLRARATGETTGSFGFINLRAEVSVSDSLKLEPLPGTVAAPVPFSITMDFNGSFIQGGVGSLLQSPDTVGSIGAASLSLSGAAVQGVAGSNGALFERRRVTTVQPEIGSVDEQAFSVAEINTSGTLLRDSFNVRLTAHGLVTPSTFFQIFASILAEGGAFAAFTFDTDLSHTASLSVEVPEGYVLRSASNVFLTAVPVPGSLMLLLCSLPIAAWRGRLRSGSITV